MNTATLILQITTILVTIFSLFFTAMVNKREKKRGYFLDIITKERIAELNFLRQNYSDLLALSDPLLLKEITDNRDIKDHIYKISLSAERLKCIFCNIYEEEKELKQLASEIVYYVSCVLQKSGKDCNNKLKEAREVFSIQIDIFDHAYWFFIMGQANDTYKGTAKDMDNDSFLFYYNDTKEKYKK